MRRWIVEVEISCEELANATVELADLAAVDDLPAETLAVVVRSLEVLGWGDIDAARRALEDLREQPHWQLRPVRRLTNASQTLADSVGAWLGYPPEYDYGYTWFHEGEWNAGNRRSVCWAATSA